MTMQPQIDSNVSISVQTQRVIRDFMRDALSQLSAALKDSVSEFEFETAWKRGTDDQFREHKTRVRKLPPMLSDEWLRSLPNYQTCVDLLKADVIVGPQLDRLVGTSKSRFRLEASNILWALIAAMVKDEGHEFTDEEFNLRLRELTSLFCVDRIAYKTISPLPYLTLPGFPIQLNDEIVLDHLTDDEVTRCHQVGVLQPHFPRYPLINAKVAIGIRKTTLLPKVIEGLGEPDQSSTAEGRFGNRSLFRDDLVIDDVLSALRLFKRSQIRPTGFATWTDSPWLSGGTSFRVLGQCQYGGGLELSEDEIPEFLELWRLLENGPGLFGFSIHRFNLAFDRGLLADRIVDLVIAAESLFLGDLDEKYRGELRFRFALRAAKFIEHAAYSEHDVFRVMRQAYDARSAVVHGGSPKETRLPDNQSATLPTFIDAIEDLVRRGLRKALSMREDGKSVRQAEYWDALLF
jgi:hypothetical protein